MRAARKLVWSKPGKEARTLPRRCAVIRRTYPEEGVEKTELRFVSYKSLTGALDERGFFEEVGKFLKEQVDDIDKDKSQSSSEALSSTHHEEVCSSANLLKKAIPHLEYLIQYYSHLVKQTNDVQYQILKKTAEEVLDDAQKALMKGGTVGDELMDRLEMLTKIPITDSDSSYL